MYFNDYKFTILKALNKEYTLVQRGERQLKCINVGQSNALCVIYEQQKEGTKTVNPKHRKKEEHSTEGSVCIDRKLYRSAPVLSLIHLRTVAVVMTLDMYGTQPCLRAGDA